MRTEILGILLCPRCKAGNLQLRLGDFSVSDGRVETGVLFCDRCDALYDIRCGVPALLIGAHSPSVQNAFSQQWKLRHEGILGENRETLYLFSVSSREKKMCSTLIASAIFQGIILDAVFVDGDLTAELMNGYPKFQ